MKEPEPMVELIGDIFELDSLQWWSAQSNSPLYSVEKKDNRYWLKSPRFGLRTDLYSVRAEAKELIPIIKGSAKVRGMDTQSIDVGSGLAIGEQTSQIIEAPTANAKIMVWKENDIFYIKTNGSVHEIGHEISSIFKPLIEGKILELDARIEKGLLFDRYLHQLENCIDDPYVYDTFSYFVDEPSWLSLSNTFEMIKFDVDDNLNHAFNREKCAITRNGWAEKEQLINFTETANNYLAEARPRHSRAYSLDEERKRKTPNPVKEQKHEERKKKHDAALPPMSLADAAGLITRIFRGWCKWKARKC